VPRRIEVSGGCLVYDPNNCERRKISGGVKVLESFTSLCRKEAPDILRFAERYGVLELDSDGTPITDTRIYYAVRGVGKVPQTGCESLAHWRSYSRMFSGLLAIGANLHQSKRGDADDWEAVHPFLKPSRAKELGCGIAKEDTETQKLLLEVLIGEVVLLWSGLHPVLKWSGHRVEEPGVVFGFSNTGGLFSALLLHLMLAITRVDGLAICGSCQQTFTPAVKARRGDTRFCDGCRQDGSAHRISQRNSAHRKKSLSGGKHDKEAR
jgi:hypothetical protein